MSLPSTREEADMDETSFDIDSAQLAEASRLFPAHRLAPESALGSVATLTPPGSDFAWGAWDEAGHL